MNAYQDIRRYEHVHIRGPFVESVGQEGGAASQQGLSLAQRWPRKIRVVYGLAQEEGRADDQGVCAMGV